MKKLKLSALQDRGMEVLTREQMKNVLGKMMGGSDGGSPQYMGCNYHPEMGLTCDYRLTFQNGMTYDLCDAQCIGLDGSECMPQ